MRTLVGLLMLSSMVIAAASAEDSSPTIPKAVETQWQHCGWGGGGYFWTCAWHPKDSNVIFLGGDVGGAYRSDDKGLTWKFINTGLKNYAIYAMAAAKSAPDTLFINTMAGIHKTTDGGKTWRFLEQTGKKGLNVLPHRPLSVRAVAIDPTNADVVYAGGANGVLIKTENGGEAWEKLSYLPDATAAEPPPAKPPQNVVTTIAISEKNPKLIFVSTSVKGVFRSTDAGKTWTALETPKSCSNIAVSPQDENTVYGTFGAAGLMKSGDQGKTWASVAIDAAKECTLREVILHPTNDKFIGCIANRNSNWDGYFFRSADGGQTWEAVNKMANHEFDPTTPDDGGRKNFSKTSNITLNPNNPDELFIAANWRNMFSSDGGKTWQQHDRGADITCFKDVQFLEDKVYAVAMDEGMFTSDDQGERWKQLVPRKWSKELSGHQWRVRVFKHNDTQKILSTLLTWDEQGTPARVLLSEDGGKTFAIQKAGLPVKQSKLNCMWGHSIPRALSVDPKDPNILWLGMDGDPDPKNEIIGGGVFKSTDGGKTWKQLENQPDCRRVFYGIAVCSQDSNRVYWGASGKGGGVYRTEDNGKSWKLVFDKEAWIWNVVVSPAGTVYACGTSLWRSRDNGNTWEKAASFPDMSIEAIALDPSDENRLWISRVTWNDDTSGFVLRTTDGCKTWEDITGDIPHRKPCVLNYNAKTKELWAAGVGVYRAKQ